MEGKRETGRGRETGGREGQREVGGRGELCERERWREGDREEGKRGRKARERQVEGERGGREGQREVRGRGREGGIVRESERDGEIENEKRENERTERYLVLAKRCWYQKCLQYLS